jgi:hypothetical protein
MKTPRDILLARHRAAEPKLDAIRENVLAGANSAPARERTDAAHSRSGAFAMGLTLWRELILPSRRVWSGLAATWILMALVNASQSRDPQTAKTAFRPEVAASFVEQQILLGELLTDRAPAADADQPKSFTPKPRTEATAYKIV